jgi:hypothetical protein
MRRFGRYPIYINHPGRWEVGRLYISNQSLGIPRLPPF